MCAPVLPPLHYQLSSCSVSASMTAEILPLEFVPCIFTAKCNRQLWFTILKNAPVVAAFDTSEERRKCPFCASQINF